MIRTPRLLAITFVMAVSMVPFGRALAQGSRAAVGPTIGKAAVGVRAERVPASTPAALPKRHDDRKNVAMMVVGGAALIIGAIIDKPAGTIIMVGGAGVGLYGLYRYLE